MLDQPINPTPQIKDRDDFQVEEFYTVLSMFAGCGGLDLGIRGGFRFKEQCFPKHPFQIVAAYDWDTKCVETYRLNVGPEIIEADLTSEDISAMQAAEVLVGGFPCQDFSSTGPKAGTDSARGKLYLMMRDYMQFHQPKLVLLENVPHLARMRKGIVLSQILADLEACGYQFTVWNLYAPDYGVPQRRTRLFMVGVRQDLNVIVPPPTPGSAFCRKSIKWAISDLVDVTDEKIPNQSQYFLASRAKRGNGQGDETNRPDEPSYTIRANAKSRVQFHYSLNRRLTIRECARLQTFPDDFIFRHSATANMLQIGNAVPPIMAHVVANSLAIALKTLGQT